MAQLDAVYGKELSRTIITNHALQIIYAPREQQDANDYSEMLGYRTIKRRARTRSHGGMSSVSDNEVLEKRALMLPPELKAMGPESRSSSTRDWRIRGCAGSPPLQGRPAGVRSGICSAGEAGSFRLFAYVR